MSLWKRLNPYLNFLLVLLIATLSLAGLRFLRDPERLSILGVSGLISIGLLGTWRWGWSAFQLLRSHLFLYIVFPRWRRRANSVPVEQLPPVCLLVPTYKEKPWITERVFRIIAKEAKTLSHPITLLVTSSSDAENAAILKVLKSEDLDLSRIRLIQMVQTGEGKRKAMADGLRELARLKLPRNAIISLMDGDSELTPGTLRRCLPFFCLFPKMGALTTDEMPIVEGSYLFSEWFHLRLSQRHHQMAAVSLSSKVMCLTGRFSLFRSEAALNPTFADQLENDTLDDWLWGRFKFLSGDDKSTWYWLLQRGYDMIYVPDVIVYSIETISGSLTNRAYQNMRRWFGNMLRNSDRAIALGPKKAGWYMWYCLLDQRISFWTSLVTPGTLVLMLLQLNWWAVGLILSWVICSRSFILTIIFWRRQSHLKPIHLLLLLISQWSSALIKVWTQMNLAQQKWTNRGSQSISAEGTGWVRWTKLGTSRFLYVSQLVGFVVVLCWLGGLLSPTQSLSGLWWSRQVSFPPPPTQVIAATDYGIVASDGVDDSTPLQALIDQLSSQDRVEINLPIGEIDLVQPLKIARSHTILKGQGSGRTILLAHQNQKEEQAVISVKPSVEPNSTLLITDAATDTIQDVQLKGFTLRYIQPNSQLDGILLENVTQATVNNLHLEQGSRHALVLRQTQDVTVEYVTIDGSSHLEKVVKMNAINTQIRGLTTF